MVDGLSVRLAGIRIRPIVQAVRPNWNYAVAEMIGPTVEVQPTENADTSIVYYPQMESHLVCAWARESGPPKYKRACLNDLLIRIGIATCDANDRRIPNDIKLLLEKAESNYQKAVNSGDPAFRDLSYLAQNPTFLDVDSSFLGVNVGLWDATLRYQQSGAGAMSLR